MTNALATWETESSAAKQNLAVLLTLVIGAALAIGFRRFEGPGFTGSTAGFLLGIVLLVVGVGMFIFGGKQVIAVEPKLKRIVVKRFGRLRTSSTEIGFNDISGLYVGESGDQEGGSVRFHVVAKLKTGKEVALFMGFFEGSHSKPAMEARCQRIEECMRTDG
jgi:hypothetical protein